MTIPPRTTHLSLTPISAAWLHGTLQPGCDEDEKQAFLDALATEARQLLDGSDWTNDQVWHDGLVTTRTLKRAGPVDDGDNDVHNGLSWHLRETILPATGNSKHAYPYEVYWSVIGDSHLEYEAQYDSSLKKPLIQLKDHGGIPSSLYLKQYSVPFPATDRSFLSNIVTIPTQTSSARNRQQRSFMVIQLPASISPSDRAWDRVRKLDKGHCRGTYVSVEEVTEIVRPDGAVYIRWRCASKSDAGGNIPKKITEAAIPSSLASSVPSFFTWLAKHQKTQSNCCKQAKFEYP